MIQGQTMIECQTAKVTLILLGLVLWVLPIANANSGSIAYIHGRVSDDGIVLAEGQGNPYDQMLISDSGDTGLSNFKLLVESQGHSIVQFRDTLVNLNSAFLADYDVVIFGLHQKMWSAAEKTALGDWLDQGGGMFIYSDSASGGCFCEVGAQNPVGQNVSNNLIAQYDMQVTVDQADGVRDDQVFNSASIVALQGLTIEGEGVSPVAVSPNSTTVEILIPYTGNVKKQQGLTIVNPEFAALALRPVGAGHIIVMFDRQPMWNSGTGSDIEKKDNEVILREVINFLAQAPVVVPPVTPPTDPSKTSNMPPIINLILGENDAE